MDYYQNEGKGVSFLILLHHMLYDVAKEPLLVLLPLPVPVDAPHAAVLEVEVTGVITPS